MLAGRENDLDKIIDFIIKNLDLNYNDFKFSLSIRRSHLIAKNKNKR